MFAIDQNQENVLVFHKKKIEKFDRRKCPKCSIMRMKKYWFFVRVQKRAKCFKVSETFPVFNWTWIESFWTWEKCVPGLVSLLLRIVFSVLKNCVANQNWFKQQQQILPPKSSHTCPGNSILSWESCVVVDLFALMFKFGCSSSRMVPWQNTWQTPRKSAGNTDPVSRQREHKELCCGEQNYSICPLVQEENPWGVPSSVRTVRVEFDKGEKVQELENV